VPKFVRLKEDSTTVIAPPTEQFATLRIKRRESDPNATAPWPAAPKADE
jgi:hypothetical protein